MKLRYALPALLFLASSAAMAQTPPHVPGDPELRVNSPAILAATISNYDVDIDALPRPPYALPDTSASYLVGYTVWTGETPVRYTAEGVTGDLVLALDEAGGPAIGCTSGGTWPNPSDIANASELAGKIAFIQRGTCSFIYKAHNAREAGAIGVLLYNGPAQSPDTAAGMSGGDEEGIDLSIPAMLLPWAIAEPIFNELANAEVVNVTMGLSRFATAGEGAPTASGAGLFLAGANPASTSARFEIRTPAAENVTVTAYNMLGQRVATLHEGAVLGQQVVTMSTATLPAGSYFVRAVGETFTMTQQITVVR